MRPPFPFFLAACAALACATNPATGAKELMLISESQEIAMGQGYDKDVVASIGLYADTGMQRWIQQFGSQLAATSERPNLPWTFHVVDDPVVNAFAIPGGYIYVTRGILAHLNSEAELAGVVGHEIGHVTARHSVSQMSKQQLAQVGLAIGSIASSDFERYAGAERRHVCDMLTRGSQAQGGGRVPEWLATHPNPENRRGKIEQEIASEPQDFAGTMINRDAYLRRLDGLVYGDDPREGYFKGGLFLHPGLRFRLTFPNGWATSNSKQSVVAVSPQKYS